jgi:uncharacterized protein (DUF3820 family)
MLPLYEKAVLLPFVQRKRKSLADIPTNYVASLYGNDQDKGNLGIRIPIILPCDYGSAYQATSTKRVTPKLTTCYMYLGNV